MKPLGRGIARCYPGRRTGPGYRLEPQRKSSRRTSAGSHVPSCLVPRKPGRTGCGRDRCESPDPNPHKANPARPRRHLSRVGAAAAAGVTPLPAPVPAWWRHREHPSADTECHSDPAPSCTPGMRARVPGASPTLGARYYAGNPPRTANYPIAGADDNLANPRYARRVPNRVARTLILATTSAGRIFSCAAREQADRFHARRVVLPAGRPAPTMCRG